MSVLTDLASYMTRDWQITSYDNYTNYIGISNVKLCCDIHNEIENFSDNNNYG